MGRRSLLGVAALLASLPAARVRAETQMEPIARLSVAAGYDSNVLFDGRGDQASRVSPELGLKLRDHLWDFTGVYGVDYLQYQHLRPEGVWNQRGVASFAAAPSERFNASGTLKGTYADDPVGLAQAGIFRTGQERALYILGGVRAEYGVTRRLLVGAGLAERFIRFEDSTGGAMHGPSVEMLRALNERVYLGGAYAITTFQDFQPTQTQLTFAHALRARMRYKVTRFLEGDAYAGPALWSGPGGRSMVPEAGAELRLAQRDWDLRVSAAHALGLGSAGTPALVNSVELGTDRRFGRKFDVRSSGGIWQTGEVPTGRNATLGFAISAEGGWHVTRELRLALAGSYLSPLDNSSPVLRRTTVGIQMGWELPVR